MPPPTRAAIEAEWCGARKGRRLDKAPSARWPATDWIMEISSSSRGARGGRIDGRRCASMDLPAPGGPLINKLCYIDFRSSDAISFLMTSIIPKPPAYSYVRMSTDAQLKGDS